MIKKITLLILTIVLISSCTIEEPYENSSQLVVEGWIENGRNPMVFVTMSLDPSAETISASELRSLVLRYAKVTIEHNGITYPLVANLSDDYYLQNYFTTSKLFGEVGETYTLRVEYNDQVAVATTTINEPVEIDSFEVLQSVIEGNYRIQVAFHDNPQTKDYYKFSVQVTNKEKKYSSSYMSMIDDSLYDSEVISIIVDRGNQLPNLTPEYNFQSGDVVKIKLQTITQDSYRFWANFNQNSLITLLPVNISAPGCVGNVDGALGYWDGYGINEYTICVD